ncbi:MAG: hypothetical protein HYV26_00965, partial [Candidatus Hydrogenedentes bacterium]|nr:hypothetical protein [Candidatus Hydrogenedentota bacterium]
TISFLHESLQALRPVPVFIAPGNHDPFVRTSPYASEAWPANVFIFARPVWQQHELKHLPLTIHGFAFDGIEISANPFGSLTVPQDGRVHVALGHGSERGHQPADKPSYAPFDAADAACAGLHYLALGHFHSYTAITGNFSTTVCYSGAPEGHGFNEPGPRHYVEVEIAQSNGAVRVQPRPVVSSQIVYAAHTLDISEFTNAQQLVEALRALAAAQPYRQIARIRLIGCCAPGLLEQFPAVADAVAEHFEHLQLLPEVTAPEDFDALAREKTSLGAFIGRMNSHIAAAPDEERRALLLRARDVGLAAYRNQTLPIRGLGVAR